MHLRIISIQIDSHIKAFYQKQVENLMGNDCERLLDIRKVTYFSPRSFAISNVSYCAKMSSFQQSGSNCIKTSGNTGAIVREIKEGRKKKEIKKKA